MVKQSFSSEHDQNDSKIFKETLGTFGTTTTPGANQLTELRTKIRQGVKHVELHLGNQGKGEFGAKDVPDKYGFEQRRTIMQLAKLNKQTLSVHGTFAVNSFSGFNLNSGSFDDNSRFLAMKEIDETIKFAAETAKGGAVVFHMQGEQGVFNDKSELNLSKSYLNWLKEKSKKNDLFKKELENLKKNYLIENPLDRQFVSDPNKIYDIKEEFKSLKNTQKKVYDKYMRLNSGDFEKAWKDYYREEATIKKKLTPDMQPLVVVGDKLSSTDRKQELLDLNVLTNKNNFSKKELDSFNKLGIDLDNFNIDSLQKIQSLFSNGFPNSLKNRISKDEFDKLKSKVLITYDSELRKNNYLQAQADESFHKKLIDFQIDIAKLQKKDLDQTKLIYGDYLEKINNYSKKENELISKINRAKKENNLEDLKRYRKELNGGGLSKQDEIELKNILNKLNSSNLDYLKKEELLEKAQELEIRKKYGIIGEKLHLMQNLGQEYQKLEKYNELNADLNNKIKELDLQKKDLKSFTDVSFNKNVSGMAHLAIKALKYQLDLKKKSKNSQEKLKKIYDKIKDLKKEYNKANSYQEKEKINQQILREEYKTKKLVGLKDYNDIDLINNPLYLAPENMLPGYGTLTSLEDYKAVMRMSQEEFAKKILSDEKDYKLLKEEYEKETGLKIKTHEDALKLAKRHLAGTFDNAHAAVWLKHFKREEGESDEHRLERFNSWLLDQSELMVKEGLIKHIHFNDTLAKDDDHNLLGEGILDLHKMKDRLRKAGLKEALIIEAGGRGANSNDHILNAFNIFDPNLTYKNSTNSTVSDWIGVSRNYSQRLQYSQYGMSYTSFKHIPPQQGHEKGSWSGSSFF